MPKRRGDNSGFWGDNSGFWVGLGTTQHNTKIWQLDPNMAQHDFGHHIKKVKDIKKELNCMLSFSS